jgi:phosphonate transport system substrate-binding protein
MSLPPPHLSRRRVLAAAAGLTPGAGLWPVAVRARAPLGVAVVPQFSAAVLHRDWTPLLDLWGRRAGVTFQLQLHTSIPRFEAEVLAGTADLCYLNPYHQVMAHRSQGYLPLARSRVPLTGVLVVRRDDPIASLRALDGRTLAFPAPNAFGASLWMRALLTERERLQFTPQYVQTHSNVYRQVLAGQAAAGGGVNHTLHQEREEVRQGLRVLFETPGAAPHPVSAHLRLDPGLRQTLTESLLELAGQPEGEALLRAVEMEGLVRADHGRDYAPLEAYRLERYVVRAQAA